jgi:hypothetical protein
MRRWPRKKQSASLFLAGIIAANAAGCFNAASLFPGQANHPVLYFLIKNREWFAYPVLIFSILLMVVLHWIGKKSKHDA